MRIRLTNLDNLDKVLAKLDQQWPFGECNDTFIKYCIPSIKERLAQGKVIYLESEIISNYGDVCQKLSYWSPTDVLTDEDFLCNEC